MKKMTTKSTTTDCSTATMNNVPTFWQNSLAEQIQEDILTCIEGFCPQYLHNGDDDVTGMADALCQIIVDRLINKTAKGRKPRLCRIHVSQPAIRQNLKEIREGTGLGQAPVITCKRGKDNVYGHEVRIYDREGNIVATVMQPEDKQLSCGARVWVETTAPVEVDERTDGNGTLTTRLER